jgi:DNA-binding transcriptional ArsR family regulator
VPCVRGDAVVNLHENIDKKICQDYRGSMNEIDVIDEPAAAQAVLDPVRNRLLSELHLPASAADLASRVGMSRQKVNYHLRTLESHGLVRPAGEKRWGGLTERKLVASASAYLISPEALGSVAPGPDQKLDRLSASYLIAVAARAVREVGDLVRRASRAGKPLATLSIDTVIRFRSATERAEFSRELTEAVHHLAAKYHDSDAPAGRPHRLVLMAHPEPVSTPTEKEETDASEEG